MVILASDTREIWVRWVQWVSCIYRSDGSDGTDESNRSDGSHESNRSGVGPATNTTTALHHRKRVGRWQRRVRVRFLPTDLVGVLSNGLQPSSWQKSYAHPSATLY